MRIAVLGAGVIGTTTAYFLAKQGHKVFVIDRQKASAEECSRANGGQLSYGHVEPWANPHAPLNILRWMGKEDAPLVFKLKANWEEWSWGARFLLNCRRSKSLLTSKIMLELAFYSKKMLSKICEDTKLEFHHGNNGTLHIFQDEASLALEIRQAKYQKQFGCDYEVLSAKECLEREPSLAFSSLPLVGGVFFPQDETGNAHLFTQRLAEYCEKNLGVEFHYSANIHTILTEANQIKGMQLQNGEVLKADRYIASLGATGSVLLWPIGIKLPIYPMKGYSLTLPLKEGDIVPNSSITDQSHKIVYSKLGNELRIAGTAEFAGFDTEINPKRLKPILAASKLLFPQLFGQIELEQLFQWACLRPSTPDGMPIISATKYHNLFLNTGHGTLGWTLACGSAKAIADLVSGNRPEIDLSSYSIR